MLLIESLFSRPEASFVEMRERFWRRFQEREQYVRFSWRPFWICCRCAVSVSRNREQLVLYRSHAVRSLDVQWESCESCADGKSEDVTDRQLRHQPHARANATVSHSTTILHYV